MIIQANTCNHLGDHVILSGAVRHFRKAHPEYVFMNTSRYGDIFAGNPDFAQAGHPVRAIRADYRSHGGNDCTGNHGNMVNGMLHSICAELGLPVPPIDNRLGCWLPEPTAEIPEEWKGLVVLNANCQECSSTKLYPHWQRVVDLLPDVRFALIGGTEDRDIHLPVEGPNVLNLRGKTTFGQLFRLVKEARLVLSPASAVVHIANAYGVPCVCVTGASEPTVLTDYPNVIHIAGECHGTKHYYNGDYGCRHFKTTDARSCERIVEIGGRPFAHCLADIPPQRIADAVRTRLAAKAPMRIRLVTNAVYPNGVPKYVEYTDRLKRLYCEAAGWEYVRRDVNVHPEIPPHWSKPTILMEALRDCDWVVWMDCDAAPVNRDADIAGYLATVGDRIVMQKDVHGWNSGVFAVPRTRMDWLEHIESMRGDPRYHKGWFNQYAMIESFNGDWRGFVVEPPPALGWNSYYQLYHRGSCDPNIYRPGDWALHLPGVPDAVRNWCFWGISPR